jgi:nitrite reductase/ring-hydroxylating ferredoxin subunit/Fe-S cluster biogenesis protein NfuA
MSETSNPLEKLESLMEFIENAPDSELKHKTEELVRLLLDMHHGGIVQIVRTLVSKSQGAMQLTQLNEDPLVGALLVAHRLSPTDFEERVREGVAHAQDMLRQRGADVELVQLENRVAQMRLSGSAQTANTSTAVLKLVVEHALVETAPDLLGVEYESELGLATPPARSGPAGVQDNWTPLIHLQNVPANSIQLVSVADVQVLICNTEGNIHAVRNSCAHRGLSLEHAMKEGNVLTCPWHGYQYDLNRDAQCLTDPTLRLKTLPVLVSNGIVSVILDLERT